MNYRHREIIRKLAHNSKVFEYLYKKASVIKTAKNKKLDDITFFKRRYKEYIGKELNLDPTFRTPTKTINLI